MYAFTAALVAATEPDNGGVKDTVQDIASTHDQIILALIAVVATSVAALVYVIKNGKVIKVAAEQSTQANAAVNNVGPGEHRLWDKINNIEKSVEHLMRDQETFDSHGWETLPQDLGTAVGLTTTIRDLQHGHKEQGEKLDEIKSILVEHVEWEMEAKYGNHGFPLTEQME